MAVLLNKEIGSGPGGVYWSIKDLMQRIVKILKGE